MLYFLCIILPPLAVFLTGRMGSFVLNLVLTLCFYVPGMIHAFFIVTDHKNEKRIEDLKKQMQR